MRPPRRLTPAGERRFDLALAGGLSLITLLAWPLGGFPTPIALLSLAMTVPLAWRRRHPVAVAFVVGAAHLLQVGVTDQPIWGQVAFPIAVYSAARFAKPRWGFVVLAAAIAGAVIASVDWLRDYLALEALVSYVLFLSVIGVASWALGTLARTRREYVDALVERSRRLEHEAEQQAALAAADERARIAREMHDVVAHGLSVIVVQADGARYAAAQDPALAAETLATISSTGREALTEMRRMLGLLRSEESGVRPQPLLADVPHLLAEAEAGGTPVHADLPEPLPRVPDGVGLTAYRVVQEALTNVRKHAGPGARVRVRMTQAGGALEVCVADDGRGAGVTTDGKGLGLLGMRERLAAHGGTLRTGPRSGGGFEVSARIPL
ncbi:sensor histidine kinase [Nocardioides daejeonensis]|uniref:sensor histidine kinase n=1 Tax=Nocardioides daejeonensis TaxID=1046556 RepID=UPI000D741936|nr:sensor histidine kinase [Nocardioides daejeonensis]